MVSLAAPSARYIRVVEAISGEVRSGSLRRGDRLPGERELAERFEVSRATIRRALAELTTSGILESQPGRGTFVVGRMVGEPPNALMSFSELGADRGLMASSRVLEQRLRQSTLEEADLFAIAPGAAVLDLRRLRLLDGLPVSVDHSRLPAARVPGAADADFSTSSLYQLMEACGCGPRRAEYTIRAVPADPQLATLLEVAAGSPLLRTGTVAFDEQERVVELGEMVYRGDRYQFRASLTRSAGPRA